jgi:hypothetical protein
LPHWQLVWQSIGHVWFVSPHAGWHWKLPQMHGCPQSFGHVDGSSPQAALH